MEIKTLYTVAEAATTLGLSRSKLYGLMGRGYLPYVLIGRSRRIPAQAIMAFVQDLLDGRQVS